MADVVRRVYVSKDSVNGFANLPCLPHVWENQTNKRVTITDMQSHHLAVIRNCSDSQFAVFFNQRIRGVIMINCKNCQLQVLDSAVFVTQTCTVINCESCELVFEDVDVNNIELYGVKQSNVIIVSSPPLTERIRVHWREGCSSNQMSKARMLSHRVHFGIPFVTTASMNVPEEDGNEIVTFVDTSEEFRWEKSTTPFESSHEKLQKLEEIQRAPFPFSAHDLADAYEQEKQEYYDSPDEIRLKARQIIEVLKASHYGLCFTGAGVSTSAKIPDFRGPTGVWTNKETGKQTEGVDITSVSPTFTHYALTHLVRLGLIKFMITSNVDSLHLRTGIPRHLLIEHHGNVYKEICEKCGKVTIRGFDVEHIGNHYTGWFCTWCYGKLRDSHVGFGENVDELDLGTSLFHARKADVSFILGTSMNVQPSVAFQLLPKKKPNGKVILVNLQKTPYDDQIDIRVFAKTDEFMKIFMEELDVTTFDQTTDLLKYWDTYDAMKREQLLLRQHGTTSIPFSITHPEKPKLSWVHVVEGIACAVFGFAAGFVLKTYLKK